MLKRFLHDPFLMIVAALAVTLVISIAKAGTPNFTAPQEQASALAVPQPVTPVPASVLAVVFCNSVVGLVVIDDTGTVHPVPLKGITKENVNSVLALVPSEKVIAMNLGCPGNRSKDTTVL